MTFLLFSDDFSRSGILTLAARYSSDARVQEFLDRVEADPRRMVGETLPGNFKVVLPVEHPRGGPTLRSVLWMLGLGSFRDGELFLRVGLDGPVVTGVPVPSDLDAQGRCRCGCGYGETEP